MGSRELADFGIESTVAAVERMLLARRWLFATAESCTGGWIAKQCTDRPGSSAWFERGYVTYSNRAKIETLGVSAATLEAHGAVSEAVAREMAEGARRAACVEAALSVTGIAGPDGGTPGKPVGTVWFAWSCDGRPTVTGLQHFTGDRQSVRWQSVVHALAGLLRVAGD